MDATRFDEHFGTRAAGSEGPLATDSVEKVGPDSPDTSVRFRIDGSPSVSSLRQ